VSKVNRNAAFATGALIGAAVALVYRRRHELPSGAVPTVDPRAEELRQKLAEARTSRADEDDFEAAGQGAETVIAEEDPKKRPFSQPPGDEFEAMRRRIHEEGKAAAEEMRREGGS
jgi:hypothetical protein